MVLVVVLWALVLIPLLWGIYQTLIGVVALFYGRIACQRRVQRRHG